MFKALSIAVLLLFLQPQVSNTAVWMLYEMNKADITAAFCINKDKPELKCNGKCHLAKQLAEPHVNEGEQPAAVNYIPQIQLFFQAITQPIVLKQMFFPAKNALISINSYQLVKEIDRPPRT